MAISLPDLQEVDKVSGISCCPPDIKNKEIWLISIPSEVQLKSLNGKQLVLNSDDSTDNNIMDINTESYSVNINKDRTKVIPIIVGRKSDRLSFSKKFKGEVILNQTTLKEKDEELIPLKKPNCREEIDMCELKDRWKPFGHKTPKYSNSSRKHKHKKKKSSH